MKIRVWAPHAERVDVLVHGRRLWMTATTATGAGYFELEHPELVAGVDYAFSLDYGPATPDPRSAHQPAGVHGASRLVDHAAFSWTDAAFRAVPLEQAVIYEAHVGSFTPEGTFEAALSRLDHLLALGVTHLELMPVCEFAGERGWGYDGVDLFAPHHAYGGPEGLKRLIDGCHSRGIAVIIDVVYNHLGPSGNYLGRFGPYFTHEGTPWGAAVNLGQAESTEVRRFFIDNALMWLSDYHADGLRLDAVQAYRDDSAFPFLEELSQAVHAAGLERGKHWVLIAECDRSDPRTTLEQNQGGLGVDAQWSDDFHFALHGFLTGERNGRLQDFGGLEQLAAVLQFGFWHRGRYSSFRQRAQGHPVHVPSLNRLLGYLQTHDQVGNRPGGERSSMLLPLAQLKQATALVLLSPFVPMLFQGEEWGASSPFLYFTDHDEELGRQVRAGREREYRELGFALSAASDPQSLGAFERSKLVWSELSVPPHAEILEWYRRLLELRRNEPQLRAPPVVAYDAAADWLTLTWPGYVLALCFGKAELTLNLRMAVGVLTSENIEVLEDKVRLGTHGVALVKLAG